MTSRSERRKKTKELPAEMGRPKTAAEFARQVRDHFVLHGPGERKKGGEEDSTHLPDTMKEHTSQQAPDGECEEERFIPLAQLPAYSDQDKEKTLDEIRGQYHLDPFFQR
jgi:hypothetical protein